MKRRIVAAAVAALVVVGAVIWTRNLDTAQRKPLEGEFAQEQITNGQKDEPENTADVEREEEQNGDTFEGPESGEPENVYIPAEPFKELEQLINEDSGGEDGGFGSGADGSFGGGADGSFGSQIEIADVDKAAIPPDEILGEIKTEAEPVLEENTETVSRIWYDEGDSYEVKNGIVTMVYRFPTGGRAFMRGKTVTFDEAVELPRFTEALRELFPDSFDDVYEEFVRIRHWEDLWRQQNAAGEVPWTGYVRGRYFGMRYVQMSVSSQQVSIHVYPAGYEDEYLPKPGEVTEFYNYRPE